MKRLLITGFDPFDGSYGNPSWMAVEQLPEQIGDFFLRKQMLPTVYQKAARVVLDEAESFHPDIILCVGVAANRNAITPERIGVNIRDSQTPDNAGNRSQGEYVLPDGPAAYFSTAPVEKMAQAIRDVQIPAVVSNTAGTFVCNDVFYTLLHHFDGSHTQVGFIHVPALPEQASNGMPLHKIVTALTTAILACQ